ncbi:MAG: bifunctional precorrin-2 dehydrogenase/sirohydrochlorin ferrochelatase [Lachnospiraceae bacterium]|nr:bifunctional precorrin-2 dehydrogenase/sirohydrochlorin ferrochelatase [Lachnospiraceae bacterium]
MFFPLFADLSGKEILVVGAGRIAERRIRALDGFAAHITVVAPDILPEILPKDGNEGALLSVFHRSFIETDLEGKDLVLAATNDAALNRYIRELCQEKNLPVNVCTDASLCDFQFPSIIECGKVVIGLNASGQDHHLVKETRKKAEAILDGEGIQSRYSG